MKYLLQWLSRKIFLKTCEALAPLSLYYKSKFETNKNIYILTWHRVSSKKISLFPVTGGLNVDPTIFKQQIDYLVSFHNFLTMDELSFYLKSAQPIVNNSIILTFDDAYSDFRINVLPILEKYNIPAIVYVSPGFWEGKARLWWYELEDLLWRLNGALKVGWEGTNYYFSLNKIYKKKTAYYTLHNMMMEMPPEKQNEFLNILWESSTLQPKRQYAKMLSEDDIRSLANHRLVTIGAHTYSHSVLSSMNNEKAKTEIVKGKRILEDITQIPIEHFAYPYGTKKAAYRREYNLIQEIGFKTAVTTIPGKIDSKFISLNKDLAFRLPRLAIRGDVPWPSNIKIPISGVEEFLFGIIPYLRK